MMYYIWSPGMQIAVNGKYLYDISCLYELIQGLITLLFSIVWIYTLKKETTCSLVRLFTVPYLGVTRQVDAWT
jgi:hypothetical protein